LALFEPVTDTLLALLILLLLSRTFGLLSDRFSISPMFGNVLAGLALSPLILNVLTIQADLSTFASFAIIVIMFHSGINTDFSSFKDNRVTSLVVGTFGVIVSFFLIFSLSFWIFDFSFEASLFLGAILSNSAIEVCSTLLRDSRDERIKSIVIGASFVDDVLAVFVLGVVLSFVHRPSSILEPITGETSDLITNGINLVFTSIKVIAFLLITFYLLTHFTGRLLDRFSRRGFPVLLSIGFILAFALGIFASWMGLHEIIGVYLAGLILSQWGVRSDPMLTRGVNLMKFKETLSYMMVSLFSPLFFGYVGIRLGDALIDQGGGELLLLFVGVVLFTIFSFMGKIVGCGAGARIKGMVPDQAVIIGIAMIGRGALELILIRSGADEKLIDSTQFSILTIVTLFTILLTPVLYRFASRRLRVG